MLTRFFYIIALQFFFAGMGIAQSASGQLFSLEECIEQALANSLDLQGSGFGANRANINLSQSKSDRLPALNFNYNLGRANGRSIDPFSNDVVTEGLNFSNAGLNLEANVFNGFRLKHTIKQNEQNLAAAEMQRKVVEDLLVLDVTLAYLQVLNSKDFIQLSKASLATTEGQLARLEVLYKEEVGNPATYFDMKAQVSNDQLNLLNLENQLSAAFIQLANLMNVEVSTIADVQALDQLTSPEKYALSPSAVYQQALKILPGIQAQELTKEALRTGVLVEQAARYPSLSIFGNLNTNYSSAAQTFTEAGTAVTSTDNFIELNNDNIPVLKNSTLFDASSISYFTQFQNNLNSSFGIVLRVPIFNGFITKNNVALQNIAVQEQDLEIERTKQQLRQAIETAHLNMTTAYHRYQVLSEQIASLKESFRVNEIRFNKGLSNTVEYLVSKNTLDNGLLNLSTVKYEYELRRRVLMYYRGGE